MCGSSKHWIRNREGSPLGMGSLNVRLYHLDCEHIVVVTKQVSAASEKSADMWHHRLGHVNALSEGMVIGIKLSKEAQLSFCGGCVEGKMQCQLPLE